MKYRFGFVTNSSSTSYICDICGSEEVAYDFPDYWLRICSNDHYFCASHIKEYFNIDYKEWRADVSSDLCPICQFKTYHDEEMARYLLITRQIPYSELAQKKRELFGISQKHPSENHATFSAGEYVSYVCNKLCVTKQDLLEEVRERFKNNYDEYRHFIN